MDPQKLRIVHDFMRGQNRLGYGTANSQIAYERNAFPDIIHAGVALEVTFVLWQDQLNGKRFDCTTAETLELWGRAATVPSGQILLGSTTAPTDPVNIFTITVDEDKILPGWAAAGRTVLTLKVEKAAELEKFYVSQFVTIVDDATGEGSVSMTFADIPMFVEVLTGNTILTGAPGWRTYLLDSSAGAFTVTLPTPGSYSGQRIEFIRTVGAAQVDIDPGAYLVNGVAGLVPMPTVGDYVDLREFVPPAGSAYWVNANPVVVVV